MSICLMQWHVYNDVLHAATSQVPGSRSAVVGLHASSRLRSLKTALNRTALHRRVHTAGLMRMLCITCGGDGEELRDDVDGGCLDAHPLRSCAYETGC